MYHSSIIGNSVNPGYGLVMLRKVTVNELLTRIGVQSEGNIWSATVVVDSEIFQAVEELSEGIEIFAECRVQSIDVSEIKLEFIEAIDPDVDYVVLWNFGCWIQMEWQGLDSFRSRLDRGKRGGILIVSQQAVEQMISAAPNFSSWVGGKIFQLVLDEELLSDADREARLSALRSWTGWSDQEVLAKATAQELPSDPEYGEWLILLGRGDLIGR
jgi:hypothetical protein